MTPMRCTPMTPMMHAYDAYEMHAYDAYEMHAYEMAYGRCTPMSWLLCERSHHLPRPHVTRALPISVKLWVFGGGQLPAPHQKCDMFIELLCPRTQENP